MGDAMWVSLSLPQLITCLTAVVILAVLVVLCAAVGLSRDEEESFLLKDIIDPDEELFFQKDIPPMPPGEFV
uniref:Col_cuticle_N domain-containing protein n=1 Tax=Steinernema glaseri TaxID=37863 RepID=A0A1I8ALS4_9BILA